MTRSSKTLTISIPRNAVWHLLIGAILAAGAVAAFIMLTHLPAVSPYRLGIGLFGVIGACGALAYWLWCTLQRNRQDETTSHEAIQEDLATHREEECEHAEQARTQATALRVEVEELGGKFKQLVDEVAALTTAVEILRDCYLEEGRVQDRRSQSTPPREP